ncbi:acyl-CoA thioester hydrolase, YbgC/YbaW family [Thermomonospora echinospora]|uniref:Acyl-CoA thioester hydrolase, YbgC/YbaW family n=1 Tax=Thermomonospora echinospora TaxID=1992 RepID=A0A1H6DJQ9_9ACTN|nr:hotdog domain-containing protein [Thermomonospora echinospora]SEG84886.1 acyl-CoA thioester hydrolase, YbgC/YbaW family [Thermomonospora echinospora]
MRQDEAWQLLDRLHQAQNAFYQGGDAAALREVLAEDVVWHVPGRSAVSGDHRGIDAVLGYFARRRELAGRSFRLAGRQVLVGDGDRIAAVTDGHAVIDGQEFTWPALALYQVRHGRIAACRLLPFDVEEFDAIWADRAAGPAHEAPLRVRPRHCDAQGMVHASRYYEFFEDAFVGWLDEHAGGYARLREAGTDLVVVSSGCDHGAPARLDDRLTVRVRPVRVGRTSLTMSFTVHRRETVIVTGQTAYVAVGKGKGSVPLPEPLRAVLHSPPTG